MKNKILKILAVPLILAFMILPLCSWTSIPDDSTYISLVAPYGTSLKIGYTSYVYRDIDGDGLLEDVSVLAGYVYNPQNILVFTEDYSYGYDTSISSYVDGSYPFFIDDLDLQYTDGYYSAVEEFGFYTSEGVGPDYSVLTKVDGRFDITYSGDSSPLSSMYFYHNNDEVIARDLEYFLSTITIMEYNSYMGDWRLKIFDIYDAFRLYDYGYAWDDYELDVYNLTDSILHDLYPEYDLLTYRIVNVKGQFFNRSEYVTDPAEYDFVFCRSYVYEESQSWRDMRNSLSSYEKGYRDGINSAPETWSEAGNFLIDFLGSFTQAQIFPGVTIGGVLGIVAGGLLLLVFLKMFAGG